MSRPSRIAVGGIGPLETNTFVPVLTMRADTRHPIARSTDELLAYVTGIDNTLSRSIDAPEVPAGILQILFAAAVPGGPVDGCASPTPCNGMAPQSRPSATITSQGMRVLGVRSSAHDLATAGEIASEDISTSGFVSSRRQTLPLARRFMSATEADLAHV